MNDIHKATFIEEAQELLVELESVLLELEEAPDDLDLVGKAFRCMHTIKGSGAMFGFDDIAGFTHQIETAYDKVRNGDIAVTKELISLTLRAGDIIKAMLEGSPAGAPSWEIADAFAALVSGQTQDPGSLSGTPSVSPQTAEDASTDMSFTYRVRFKPQPSIFATGTNPVLLLDELRGLGDCEVIAQREGVPNLENLDAESCYVYWDIILTTDKGLNAIQDVFIFVEDQCELTVEVVSQGDETMDGAGPKKLGQILVERGDITEEQLEAGLQDRKKLGEILVEKGVVAPDKVESALAEQKHLKKVREKGQDREESISSIRVPAGKLDVLVNLVGELVTVQARLSQTASTRSDNELLSVAEEVERLTAELRDNTLNIRMLPIGTTFGRFKRLIRDLSQELGKEIEMTTEGAETELDKTVIERLNDPLVHLIRNSIDHGIELPDERVSAGKPRTGNIHLSAIHSGAQVIIEIRDDGKGLDRQAILAKAVERGLAFPNAELTERETFGFIFAAGFSTADKITNVSGRGVGMDVVRRSIDALGGSIEVKSQQGKGTTVRIALPLTLAIVDGLLVKIGNDHFVLPLSIVEECIELTEDDVERTHGRNVANIRGNLIPYIRLRDEFGIGGQAPRIQQIVIAGLNNERIGFVVDSVIGQHQTVIKNLGRFYKDVEDVSGATILGDGSVALIIDVQKLVKQAEAKEAAVA
jgi:two-component system chemotaxis sensor kinase CheA